MGRYRIDYLHGFSIKLCDTHMLYFLVFAKFFVIMLRVCTSNRALVKSEAYVSYLKNVKEFSDLNQLPKKTSIACMVASK